MKSKWNYSIVKIKDVIIPKWLGIFNYRKCKRKKLEDEIKYVYKIANKAYNNTRIRAPAN